MRISNPKLFNGQTLATKQQISAWLAGIDNTGFGTLSIPSASISGLSELAAAVSNNTADISTNATNISTISSALGTINSASETTAFGKILALQSAIKDLTGQEGDGNVLSLKDINDRLTTEITGRTAADEYISGIVGDLVSGNYISGNAVASDLKALDTNLKTVSGDLDTLEVTVGELSDWQTTFVDKTATVEGTGLVEVTSGKPVSGVQTFTVNVPSAAAFYNHDIKLSGVATTEGYASSYALVVDGDVKGDTINIPKDQFLRDATYNKDTESLEFIFEINTKDADGKLTSTQHTVSIDAKDLVHEYESGDGIYVGNTVSGTSIISAVIDTDSESFLTVGTKGLKLSGVSGAIADAVADADAKLVGISGTVSGAIADAVADKALQNDLQVVSDKLVGISGTVSAAINTAVSGKAEQSDLATVSSDLDTLEAKVGDLVSGNYISGDAVASDLTALDTQVKANADAIATNAAAIEKAMQIVSVPLTAADGTVEFDGVMCYSYAAPNGTEYILQVISGGAAVCADISGTTVYVDSTELAAAPVLSALIAKPVTSAE